MLFDIRIQFGGGGLMRRVRRAWGQNWQRPRKDREVLDVVAELPERRQGRRRSVWKSADQMRVYSVESLRAFADNPPYSTQLERELREQAQR